MKHYHEDDCQICHLRDNRKLAVNHGKHPSFLVVAYGISRHYGGPEEGGWWYNRTQVLEVRKAHTFQGGIRQAHELKNEHPTAKYGRGSCANRGEQDVYVRVVYNESDPRMPEDKNGYHTYE